MTKFLFALFILLSALAAKADPIRGSITIEIEIRDADGAFHQRTGYFDTLDSAKLPSLSLEGHVCKVSSLFGNDGFMSGWLEFKSKRQVTKTPFQSYFTKDDLYHTVQIFTSSSTSENQYAKCNVLLSIVD